MLSKATVIGHVGKEPEVRYTPQGQPVCTFSLAHNIKSRKEGESERALWFRVTCWRGLAEMVAEHVTPGTLLYVAGDLDLRPWTDRDGQERQSLEITAVDLRILKSKGEGGASGTGGDVMEDEIPF